MIQENEVIMLILSIGTLTAIKVNSQRLVKLPQRRLLFSSFVFFTLSAVFTNLESFFFPVLFNIIEHLCVAMSSILLLVWCFRVREGTK